MAGVPGARPALGAGFLISLLLAAIPGRVDADQGSIVLADDSLASIASDLDGDGAREVIAVRRHPDDGTDLVLEAWTERDGAWPSLGSSRIERWDGEEGRPQPARFAQEGFGLLTVRNGSRATPIVATVTQAGDNLGGCCLSLSVIGMGEAAIAIDLVERTFGSAETLQVVDLEGDGVDELIVSRRIVDDLGVSGSEHALLRQTAGGFELHALPLSDGGTLHLAAAGESDGEPGDDLIFVDFEATTLARLVADADELVVERVPARALGMRPGGGWVAGVASGVIGVVDGSQLSAIRWPRGGHPEVTATLSTGAPPFVMPFGQGRTARWIDLTGMDPNVTGTTSTRIYRLDLKLEQEIEAPPLTRRLWEMNTNGSSAGSRRFLWEHAGPIPGGLGPDLPAFLGHGSLIAIESDGSLETRSAVHLVGVGVLGVAGTDGAWLAVAGEWAAFGSHAYLGNIGYEPAYGMLAVIPLADVLGANDRERPAVDFSGAIVAGTGTDERLYTADDSFQVSVSGEPGTVVVALAGGRSTVADIFGTSSVTLTVDPPAGRGAPREFEMSVFVIGPTGITRSISWQGVALHVPPEVTAAASVEPFSLRATVSGQIEGEVTLTVDGREILPSPSGRFRVDVDAPAWPRDVLVVARDPLGNETIKRLEIIGFVDYRGLPWIPIVGTLTVVAGIVLFVRTPRLRPERRLRPDGDGRLEEIDGDLV